MWRRIVVVMARAMVRPLKLHNMSGGVCIGLILSQIFFMDLIQRCGDVELNPGPSGSEKDNPGAIKSWISGDRRETRSRTGSVSEDRAQVRASASAEDTMTKVMSMLKTFGEQMQQMSSQINSMNSNMDTKLDDLKKEVQVLRQDNIALQDELGAMNNEMTELRKENATLQKKNSDLYARVEENEDRIDDLEGRYKRNNLIFYGLSKRQGETSEDCEGLLNDLITDKLDITDDVSFDRVHRLGGRSDSPVIARCTFYKQKINILKAKSKLRGTDFFIGEDFSKKVRDIRRRLTPHLKKARQEGRRAAMVFDHLLIDGKKYSVGSDDKLVEIK